MRPIWSAAVDARVLNVRACAVKDELEQLYQFDVRRFAARALVGAGGEHVRIDQAGRVIRLDVVEGTLLDGPVSLLFALAHGPGLRAKLSALREFCGLCAGLQRETIPHRRMAGTLLALHAFDAQSAGVSLRMIAEVLLGPGDWPGDGECRKSRVRRLVASGEALIRAGPRAVLA